MKIKSLFAAALITCCVIIAGCAGTNKHRVVLNTSDSIVTAVNLAEKAWASYTVANAKKELQAAGVTPTVEALTAKVNEDKDLPRYAQLDADYRVAFAAYLQAYEAFQVAGDSGVLDPAFREKAVAAANALIEAVQTISGKTLNRAQ